MASYEHEYAASDHRSQRHDSFRDPQDYLNPHTSYDTTKRPREQRRSVSRRREDDSRYHDGRPRSARPSAHSSDDQRSRHRRRSNNAWPPQPQVESEARSLAKEAGGLNRLREASEEKVPSRGTIDQDPIIEDVPEYTTLAERRFVMLPKDGRHMPTPPSSEDEHKRRQRRPSRLQTDFSDIPPEMQTRTASPYGSVNATTTQRPARMPANTFLSPDVLTPPVLDTNKRRTMGVSEASHNRSPRTSPTSRKGRDYFGGSGEYSDNAIEDADDTSRPSSRGSQVRAGAPQTGQDASRQRTSDKESRRQTDVGASTTTSRGIDRLARPAPLAAAAAAGALTGAIRGAKDPRANTPRSATLNTPSFLRETSNGSRNASPAASIHSQRSASPPPMAKVSRYSTDLSQDQNLSSPDSRRASAFSSRAGSRPSTPPSANVAMPRMPQTDDDWSSLLAANAANAARRGPGKPPSRLSASTRADSLPNVFRGTSSTVPRPGPALPYPMQGGFAAPDVFMPQETEHQWFPPSSSEAYSAPRKQTTVGVPPASERPPRQSRQSFTGPHPAKETKLAKPDAVSQPSVPEVRPTKQEAEAMLKRGLPGCSRPQAVAGYDDWYTLLGAPSLDFCPKCIDVFERTVYRKCFRRAVPRDLGTKVRCAFGTPWIRLAYLLSVQERLPNLKLMKDLADIDDECDPCPGHKVAVRTWHGLRDDRGLYVRDFNICQADIMKLQHLLPTFKGFFQRLPDTAAYEERRCSLRPETHRFSLYLDAIIGLHDKAQLKNAAPDRMPFVALVERKLSYRECERDALLVDGLWHSIPSVPALTVCEDCFEEIVEPEIKKGSDLAKRFNRAVQPNYSEGSVGTSCQLYSPRMRQVFKSAIKDNDIKYLTRKANARREAELRLQERHSSLLRKAQRIGQSTSSADDLREKRRVERELEKITAEWREDWE